MGSKTKKKMNTSTMWLAKGGHGMPGGAAAVRLLQHVHLNVLLPLAGNAVPAQFDMYVCLLPHDSPTRISFQSLTYGGCYSRCCLLSMLWMCITINIRNKFTPSGNIRT